jgi:hypothetical protein
MMEPKKVHERQKYPIDSWKTGRKSPMQSRIPGGRKKSLVGGPVMISEPLGVVGLGTQRLRCPSIRT